MIPTTPRPAGYREWIGRVTLTLTVTCGTLAAIVWVSNALRAGDEMVHLENSVAELSQFIAISHVSIRERVTAREPFDDDVAALNSGVERRLARIRAALKQPAGVARWTSQLSGSLNLYGLAEARRAYVSTAIAALYAQDGDRAADLRRFELSAQKLIVTVDGARDSIEPSRARARDDANAVVTLALGMGGLVIVYLVWLPVFGRARTPRVPLRTATIHRIPAIF